MESSFKPANLIPGDALETINGSVVYVTEVRVERLPETINVYNLEIEDLHTYYVAGGALVHNMCDKQNDGKSIDNTTKPKGWKVGDPIDNLTKAGNEPTWSTVRARYLKNKAYFNADDFSESNLLHMRKGLAPIELETGASM